MSGFVLTTILGIVGAFVATYLGQAVGWYSADKGSAKACCPISGMPRLKRLGSKPACGT